MVEELYLLFIDLMALSPYFVGYLNIAWSVEDRVGVWQAQVPKTATDKMCDLGHNS